MAARVAISVSHLSKHYPLLVRGSQTRTSVDAIFGWARRRGTPRMQRRVAALDDVSFEVARGEILGLVGRNGAGKSTLLKVLTRITAPTQGHAKLAGRVGSLLEIGTGFHPELTGRENVFLNGTLLGMKKKEIQRRFDEIVAFSGVERFLDTQVKRFSTGMYVRLAFGVAAHLENEILVVDEVLAVGDSDFQARCLRKMSEVAQSGRTVLLVSHQLQTISALASTGLYLDKGRLIYSGPVQEALDAYKQSFEVPLTAGGQFEAALRPGSGELRFDSVTTSQVYYEPQEEKVIDFSLAPTLHRHQPMHVACQVVDRDRVVVAQCDSRLVNAHLQPGSPLKGSVRIRSPWLKPGRYSVDMYLACLGEVADQWESACSFEVLSTLPYPGLAPDWAVSNSPVLADFSYQLA
jgi:lipopolysaccharide transport system ATP-binding protein